MIGHIDGGHEVIVAEDHVHTAFGFAQRQAQPELHQMIFVDARSAHHALCRSAGFDDAAIGSHPVVMLIAEIEIIQLQPGDFAVVNIAQARSGLAHAQAVGGRIHIHQADGGQQ